MSVIVRETKETRVRAEIIPGGVDTMVDTTLPFLDHMMTTLARYAGFGLVLSAEGDLPHHLAEDVAIATGLALREAFPGPLARYGHQVIPMDEALVECTLDVGGRFYYAGRLPSTRYDHWVRSFADQARCTLHLRVLRGRDRHHIVEAAFKALGMALAQAIVPAAQVRSTKGEVRLHT
jgi:imidazoleglycerol-phosphate dehydratase